MKKKLSYSLLLKLFPAILVLVIIIIYQLAISETFALKSQIKLLEKQSLAYNDAPAELEKLKKKIDLNRSSANNVNMSADPFIDFIGDYALINHVKLYDYSKPHIANQSGFEIETRMAVLTGTYSNLLRILNKLEKEYRAHGIISVAFYSEIDRTYSSVSLFMKIYLQTINKNNNGTK